MRTSSGWQNEAVALGSRSWEVLPGVEAVGHTRAENPLSSPQELSNASSSTPLKFYTWNGRGAQFSLPCTALGLRADVNNWILYMYIHVHTHTHTQRCK